MLQQTTRPQGKQQSMKNCNTLPFLTSFRFTANQIVTIVTIVLNSAVWLIFARQLLQSTLQ